MMKMIKKIGLGVFVVCLAFICFMPINANKVAIASSEAERTIIIQESIQKELYNFLEIGTKTSERKRIARIPGSEQEYNSAVYIKNELDQLTNYKPVNNQSTTDGVESFEFQCVYDGKMYISQNIIYKRESLIETNRKVVLGAHYDSTFVFNKELKEFEYKSENSLVAEGVNDNGASVATLLALVKSLDKETLDYGFDIEVVFFGASSNAYDGSEFYSRGQSQQDAEDTLLMINIDKIAFGDYNYVYMDEFKTSQEEYVLNRLYGFKELKQFNSIDFTISGPNGLDYTHIGLESDSVNFVNRNINTINFFSGNYEEPLTYGFKEYAGQESVTFTSDDNYTFAETKCENYIVNLSNVYKAIYSLVSHDGFISVMEKNNNLNEKYEFWTNDKLAIFITAISFVILMFVYLAIFKNLKDNSKKALEGANVDKIVMQITSNLTEGDNQELNDAINKKIKHDTDKSEEM